MKRFRVTIIAICLILGWLAYTDLSLYLRNPEPLKITVAELEQNGAPREWLQIDGGYQNLLRAVSMSGSMEITSFLVPLCQSKEGKDNGVWFVTREPKTLELLKTYYFLLNSETERQEFVKKNENEFFAPRQVIGLTADNLVAEANRDKLAQLLTSVNIPVTEKTVFIGEVKQPDPWRGIFFAVVSLAGLLKVAQTFRKPKENQ